MKSKSKRNTRHDPAVIPRQSAPTDGKAGNRRRIVLAAIVLLATALVYSNSIKNGFVAWDDGNYVYNNEDIKQLNGESILKFFSTYYLKMYQPVVMISYALDYRIGELNAATYHGTNLLFHVLNVLLVFYLIVLLTRQPAIAAITALLFGIHPFRVESVAWVSERKDLLYSFFYLGALVTYVHYRIRNNNYRFYALTIALYLLSLFSKSAAVTLPLILILIDFYLNKKLTVKNQLDKIPLFLLSLVFGAISLLSQKVIGTELDYVTVYTLLDRFFIGCYALTFYIFKSILPFGLSALHPMPLKPEGFLPVKYFVSILPVIGFIWLFIRITKSKWDAALKKDIVFGLLFFLCTISLILCIPVGLAVVAERYTYLPYIGLFMILGRLYIYFKQKESPLLLRHGYWYTAAMVLLMMFCAHTAYAHNAVWKDSITLFSSVIERYPDCGVAYNNRGNVRRDHNDFAGALQDYEKAIALNYEPAFNNRGILRNRMKDYSHAIEDFNRASRIKWEREKVFYNRGIAKLHLGDYKGASEDFSRAIEINPYYLSAYNNRGVVRYEKLSEFDGAIKDFDVAIKLNSSEPELYYNRGNAKMRAGNFADALADYEKALKIQPNYPEAYVTQGVAFLKMNRVDDACQSWNRAAKLGAVPAAELVTKYCQ